MAKTLYDLMDWPEVEAIIYSESDDPHAILGPHKTSKGILVQAFLPEAEKVVLKLETGVKYPMERMEEPGFFAVLLPKKTTAGYTFLVTWQSGEEEELKDPYCFEPVWGQEDTQKFNCGIHYRIYEKMGAQEMTLDGVDGVLFSVWAPNAIRVSVVGEFNRWDGRRHQMRRLWDSGVFELFIPALSKECIYKFELKLKGNQIALKTDPYAFAVESAKGAASVVQNLNTFSWEDEKWIAQRKKFDFKSSAMSILQVDLGTFLAKKEEGEAHNYRELAAAVKAYVQKNGYTHVQLTPVMEHLKEEENPKVYGYYAVTSRYGSAKDFQYFVNELHKSGIGVFVEWMPIFFELNPYGLSAFDGTFLYEHKDMRQGFNRKRNACIFNYARPEVKNFLIANALFWVDKYHVDGIVVKKADAVLYLDYDKELGEWLPNMYGGNENLDGIEFFKHLNSVFKKRHADVLLEADDRSGWPRVTAPVEEDGLGFDLKLNDGWSKDVMQYMQLDPYFRSGCYYEFIMSMVYAYTEQFVLPISWEHIGDGSGCLHERMPGEDVLKWANLRLLYGYLMCHPGKKMLGADFAFEQSEYLAKWNNLYKTLPALHEMDYDAEGFEWVNQISAGENILSFLRKTKRKEDTLLIVCNFAPLPHNDYKVGVPCNGKYKEIFNSDAEEFGGFGFLNPRIKQAKKEPCDGREYSISIKVAPLCISVFQYTPLADAKNASGTKKSLLKETLNQKIQEAEAIGDVEKQMKAAKEVEHRQKTAKGGKRKRKEEVK